MKYLLILVLTPLIGSSQADSSVVINLKPNKINYEKAMALSTATTVQLDSITYLSINYSYSNKDSCLALGEKSIELGKNLKNSSSFANALLELGDTYRIYGENEKAIEYLNEGLERYVALGDQRQIAYAHNKLGAYYSGRGEYKKAIEQYLESLVSYEELKDTQNIFKPNLNIGLIFYRLNELNKAQDYNDKAYELAIAIGDKRQTAMALNNRGIYLKALLDNIKVKRDSFPEKKALYGDSIVNYRNQIYNTHNNSLQIAKELGDKMAIMRSLVNMAIIKDDDGQYAEALQLAREAESMSKDIGSLDLILSNKNILCNSLRNLGQLNASIKVGEESLKLARENNMKSFIAGANNELLKSYKSAGLYQKALNALEEINDYIRSTNEENTTKSIAEAEAKYQNVKKENEILEQQNEILTLAHKNSTMQKQRNLILGGSAFVLIAGFFTQRMRKLRKERNDKKEFAEALIYAQEEERKRIARDLHDGIGQSLLLIKKQMEITHTTTLENQDLINNTLEEVRSISRDLHPLQLEKFGLQAAIESIFDRVNEVSDIFVSKEIRLDGITLSDKAQLNIYRVIQEAVNNIMKHAQASAIKIEMKQQDKYLFVKVMDNGTGFDYESSVKKSKSLGLQTMRERIVNIGGQFRIKKNTPNGTVVELMLPVNS